MDVFVFFDTLISTCKVFKLSSCLFNIDFELLNDMGRRRSLSNNDRNKALQMLHSGLSCRNIAGTYGVAPNTISRLFNRFNATHSCVIVLGLGVQE